MAHITLDFDRDAADLPKPIAAGYRITITRDDELPLSPGEVQALLEQVAADRPLGPTTSPDPGAQTYEFAGTDYEYAVEHWFDTDLIPKLTAMGRAANSSWYEALSQMNPEHEQQVVKVSSRIGAKRLVDAGYLMASTTRGAYVISSQYACFKMGWRPKGAIMLMGVPFNPAIFDSLVIDHPDTGRSPIV